MKKKLFRFTPLLIVIVGVIALVFYNNKLNRKFVNLEVESVIIKRNNWQLRTTEFYLENGLRIDSTYLNNFDLKIGDSISKKSNTGEFKVYIKNQFGKYQFFENNKAE